MTESTLYVCDLDGTLLRSDGTLSEFSRRGLNELLTDGVRMTLASSRGTPAIRALLEGVPLQLPVIEFNGAFVSELESGRHLAGNVLSTAATCAAVEALLATGTDPVVSAWDGSRDRVHFGRCMNDGTSWYVEEKRAYGDSRLTPCDDLLSVAKEEQVASVIGFAPDLEATALTERLREAVGDAAVIYSARNYYCPGWSEVQIQHPAAEKGAAVPALLSACGASSAEVIACGDHLNDLGLFAVAKRSIAPANAHPAVLEAATEVVGSNDEDGVAVSTRLPLRLEGKSMSIAGQVGVEAQPESKLAALRLMGQDGDARPGAVSKRFSLPGAVWRRSAVARLMTWGDLWACSFVSSTSTQVNFDGSNLQ